jgi:hypothetical protein
MLQWYSKTIGACVRIWFVAGRAERRIGRVAETAELDLGDGGQVDDVACREASHAIARAQNAQGRIMPARGKDGVRQCLVDHGGGTGALGNDDRWHGSFMTYLAMPPADFERPLKRRLANPATSSMAWSEGILDLCLPNRSTAGIFRDPGRSRERPTDVRRHSSTGFSTPLGSGTLGLSALGTDRDAHAALPTFSTGG